MEAERFDEVVAQAMADLPPEIATAMNNVAIVIEEWPTPTQRRDACVTGNQLLLGLYEGVPLTERTSGYSLVLPDKISLFQRCLEQVYTDDEALVAGIRHTVVHEIAHHFGISDDRLHEIGAY